MRRINFRLFFIFCLLLAILTYFAFSEAYAADEGKLGNNILLKFLSESFNVLRFPTHLLFPAFTKFPFYFAMGLLVNCIFYAFALERIVHFAFYRLHEDDNRSQDTPVEL